MKPNTSKSVFWSILGAAALLVASCEPRYSPDAAILSGLPEKIDYNLHVQPILSDRCYSCHGPDKNARKAELRLDTKEGLFSIRAEINRAPVSPGKLTKSAMFHRITSTDPEYRMPKPESKLSLNDEEIAILVKWIEQGAEWKPHWAFIPPEKPELPQFRQSDWPINEIDYFVLDRLEKERLKPSHEAEKEILLRRVSLDLTGLPPSVEEIESFLANDSPDAYEKAVDRLLASPHYGESMAVDWLDLARYADTHGYQVDFYRPHWPWREWVIDAFNENLPFDDFVTWQLAGDLMPNATREQILATGFNRNHAQNNEGGIVEEEFRVEYVADRTQTFSTAFLGLTMQCSRCHDHKYDPISQKEFYQLFSFFNNVDESGQNTFFKPDMPGPTLLLPDEDVEKKIAFLEDLINEKEKDLKNLIQRQREDFQDSPDELIGRLANVSHEDQNANANGLIGYYPLEHVSNDHLTNYVPGGKSGKLINPINEVLAEDPPQPVKGRIGQGLQLPGDVALSFPGVGRFSRAEPFSIGLWVYIPKDLERGVIFHSNKGEVLYTFKGYQVSIENGFLDVRIAHNFPYNSVHLLAQDPAMHGEWVHLMLTYDGSSKAAGTRLYLNGEELEMKVRRDNLYKDIIFHPSDPSDDPPVMTQLKVGARWRGKGFTNGLVDEVIVYDLEVTALEVNRIAGMDGLNRLIRMKPPQLTDSERNKLVDYYLRNHDRRFANTLQELNDLRKQQTMLAEGVMEVMVMDEMTEPRQAYVLKRGAYDQPLEAVNPGTPSRVMPFHKDLRTNRLGLVEWLFNPRNPLPARVTVNRFWQHYFGRGIVRTTEDFGSQGERPSHPMLLDWLATEFIESGWDIKHMQKTIVLSATYRQSSRAGPTLLSQDPDNRLIARGPKARLSAEVLRDLVLASSGLLVRKFGGPSVKPYQPEGLWQLNKFSAGYEQDHGENLYRRSLYTLWRRTNPPPSMNIFDAPNRSYCVVRREKTATPLQALVLLNDPQFLEASRLLAERLMHEGGDSAEDRISFGFRLLTGRSPNQEELEILSSQYSEARDSYDRSPEKAVGLLGVGEYPVDGKLDRTELSAYTAVASTIMNFDATIMKR